MALQRSFKLSTGARIPALGLGTWKAAVGKVGAAVSHALKVGYRHIDCAFAYTNEHEVGEAIRSNKVDRKDIWITSKLWNSFHHPTHVERAVDFTLKDLGTDYLDLYLIHWPVAFSNPEGKRDKMPLTKPDGLPVLDDGLTQDVLPTWEAMEKLVASGKVRHIGLSNFTARRAADLVKRAKIQPEVNQVELNYHLPQIDLVNWSKENKLLLEAYSPLGGNTTVDEMLKEPVVLEIAVKNNTTPAQVLISWQIQRGNVVLPKSVTPERIESNFHDIQLPKEDVHELEIQAASVRQRRTVSPNWGVRIFDD